jgi:hypothetical protein
MLNFASHGAEERRFLVSRGKALKEKKTKQKIEVEVVVTACMLSLVLLHLVYS